MQIEQTRSHEGRQASQVVTVKEGDASVHTAYAGASAWLQLAHSATGAERGYCATQGLEELDQRYVTPKVDDSTDLKWFAAKATVEAGRVDEAGAMLITILEDRLSQYRTRHASSL